MSKEPFSRPVSLGGIPPNGKHFKIEADATERTRLAEAMGIPSVDSLVAEMKLRPIGAHTFKIEGTLNASVVQTDVVTLEPVAQKVLEELNIVLRPAEDAVAESDEVVLSGGEIEEVDFYEKNRIDLGRIVSEYLALALDPYPRASGVVFEGYVEADPNDDPSPFAALASLKRTED